MRTKLVDHMKRTWLELMPGRLRPGFFVPVLVLALPLLCLATPTHSTSYSLPTWGVAGVWSAIGASLYLSEYSVGLVVISTGGAGLLLSSLLGSTVGYGHIFGLSLTGGLASVLWLWRNSKLGPISLLILLGLGVGYSASAAFEHSARYSPPQTSRSK